MEKDVSDFKKDVEKTEFYILILSVVGAVSAMAYIIDILY